MYDGDIASVLITEDAVREKIADLAEQVGKDYADVCAPPNDLLLVGVLKGAVMFMTDIARALPLPVTNGVTDLAQALRYAADHGFDGVELEPGTEPFTPRPAALKRGAGGQLYTAGLRVPMNGRSR